MEGRIEVTSKELVEEVLYDFLWEVVGDKTEDVDNLPNLLKDINYLDDKEVYLSKITRCEIFNCDEFNINKITDEGSSIVVECEMPYIMSARIEKEAVWSITATTKAQVKIPGVNDYDWTLIENAVSKQDLLKYKDIVTFKDIQFDWVECDREL